MRLGINVEQIQKLQQEKGWTDTELAAKIGVSRSRLWRAKLPVTHEHYCSPGETLIIGVLNAFPEKKFDDLFFLS